MCVLDVPVVAAPRLVISQGWGVRGGGGCKYGCVSKQFIPPPTIKHPPPPLLPSPTCSSGTPSFSAQRYSCTLELIPARSFPLANPCRQYTAPCFGAWFCVCVCVCVCVCLLVIFGGREGGGGVV